MPGCAVCGCRNSAARGYLMKKFPKNPERRAAWTANVKREDWTPSDFSVLCEEHFDEDSWKVVNGVKTNFLKRNAIPTIFTHGKPVIKRTCLDEELDELGDPPDFEESEGFNPLDFVEVEQLAGPAHDTTEGVTFDEGNVRDFLKHDSTPSVFSHGDSTFRKRIAAEPCLDVRMETNDFSDFVAPVGHMPFASEFAISYIRLFHTYAKQEGKDKRPGLEYYRGYYYSTVGDSGETISDVIERRRLDYGSSENSSSDSEDDNDDKDDNDDNDDNDDIQQTSP